MPMTIAGTITKESQRREKPLWKLHDELANKEGVRKTVYFPNGETYTGSWKKNLKHGKGCLVYKNGSKYEGDWSNGVRHGLGTLWTYSDSKYKVKYSGGWREDVPAGRGVFYDANGNLYDGEWLGGRRCGHGRMAFGCAADGGAGDMYEGDWKDDLQHGRGTMTYANSDVYEGHWEAGHRSGRGTLFCIDRGVRFDGAWAADAPKAGTWSEIEAAPPGVPGALPVLELAEPQAVLADALSA